MNAPFYEAIFMERYLKRLDPSGNPVEFSRIIVGGSSRQMMNGLYDGTFFSALSSYGINTFDLARMYQDAELHFSRYLNSMDREKTTIITKCCHPTFGLFKRVNEKAALYDIEKSLRILNVGYVDLLLLHRDDPSKDIREIITFMNSFIKKGYTRLIGVSNFDIERVKEANRYAFEHHLEPFVVNEPQFSLAVRNHDPWHNGSKTITGTEHEEERKYLYHSRMLTLSYSSLADGFLDGKYSHDDICFRKHLSSASRYAYYDKNNLKRLERAEILAKEKGVSVPQLCLAYDLNQGFDVCSVVNLSSVERIKENVKAIDLSLSENEISYLEGRSTDF